MTHEETKADSADAKNRPAVVSVRIKLASALIGIFCILNAVDAYTTELGLSNGAREINWFSASFIAAFGVQGYVIGKMLVSISVGLVAIVVWRSWHKMNEEVFDFYLGLSLAFLAVAAGAVLNNLVVLNHL